MDRPRAVHRALLGFGSHARRPTALSLLCKGDRRPQLGYGARVGKKKGNNDPLRMGLGSSPSLGRWSEAAGVVGSALVATKKRRKVFEQGSRLARFHLWTAPWVPEIVIRAISG
jgi:hypothetical protein